MKSFTMASSAHVAAGCSNNHLKKEVYYLGFCETGLMNWWFCLSTQDVIHRHI